MVTFSKSMQVLVLLEWLLLRVAIMANVRTGESAGVDAWSGCGSGGEPGLGQEQQGWGQRISDG
jgi:hypothetical protein